MEQNEQIGKDFERVIGYEPIKKVLERLLDMIRKKEKYDKLGTRLPRGMMLCGEPGVGKTLIASSFIEASKLPVFVIRKDKPNGDFVNFIKQTFDEARNNTPSIVFLDDVDKFANEDNMHRDAEEYVTIQSCIDEVKNYDVFVLATANDESKLPNSLLRCGRFDKIINVKPPQGDDAVKIIEFYMRQKKFVDCVDFEDIAKMLQGKSCAVLETVINEAAILAGYENKDRIDKEDLLRAAMCVVFGAPELVVKKSENIMRKIACHEAGHTVVSEILEPKTVSFVSVVGHDGPTQGVTAYSIDDEAYYFSVELMKNRVRTLLAGKAATEIVYGEIDAGAENDIRRALNIVERFVDDYCGAGFDKFEFGRNHSNDFYARKEILIYSELENFYQEAKKILIENRKFLDGIIEALVENEILASNDIQRLKEACYS